MTRKIAHRPGRTWCAGLTALAETKGICRRAGVPLAILAACILLLAGCVSTRGPGDDVTIVRDLTSVRGCRFMGTLGRPAHLPATVRVASYDALLVDLRRRTSALGGTHLYLLNEAAGWGAAEAIGTVYRCID